MDTTASHITVYPLSVAVRVTDEALTMLTEQSAGGSGAYRDSNPWIVAHRLWRQAAQATQSLPILFSAGADPKFVHWALLTEIELVELHRSAWQTRARFDRLRAVHPIFTDLDSVFMQPTAEQLEREAREDLSQHRRGLNLQELHPYALVETPAYIIEAVRTESAS